MSVFWQNVDLRNINLKYLVLEPYSTFKNLQPILKACENICGQNAKCNLNNINADKNQICICEDGFKWNSEEEKCEDVDECEEHSDFCQG